MLFQGYLFLKNSESELSYILAGGLPNMCLKKSCFLDC